jgi:hypothetical protein
MMTRSLLTWIGGGVLVLSTPSHAAPPTDNNCKVRVEAGPANWVIEGYDPFGTDPAQAVYDVTFVNNGHSMCRFQPKFATDGSVLGLVEGGGTQRVPYTLLDLTNGVNMTPIAGRTPDQANSPVIEIAPDQQQLVRYELNVDVNSVPGDGRFTQRLFIVADEGGQRDITAKPIVVGVHIRPTALLGLSGAFRRSNGQADVDLGELRTGVVALPLQLHVRSTRAYELQFQSRNGGKLLLADNGQWAIPYSLIVDDTKADIVSGSAFSPSLTNSLKLDNLPIAFDIGSIENMRAGTYSDLITVSVSVK